jgi:hypothetical protein
VLLLIVVFAVAIVQIVDTCFCCLAIAILALAVAIAKVSVSVVHVIVVGVVLDGRSVAAVLQLEQYQLCKLHVLLCTAYLTACAGVRAHALPLAHI